jgi:hypothetical protein
MQNGSPIDPCGQGAKRFVHLLGSYLGFVDHIEERLILGENRFSYYLRHIV